MEQMILTYKVGHGKDFSRELGLARRVAEYAVRSGSVSSADVAHLGLKSMISNQVLRKYSRNERVKRVGSVKLTVPSQGVKVRDGRVCVACLGLELPITFPNHFSKVNLVEVGGKYAYISVSFDAPPTYVPDSFFGVDRNSRGHCLVASNTASGKVLKLGKKAAHVHKKYSRIRRRLQQAGKFGLLGRIKDRESRVVRDLNHQCSVKLVEECVGVKAGIVLEDLDGIRKTAKVRKRQRYSLNSWSFYQLQGMIEYKAKKRGVPVFYVEPQYTSQRCCRCGHIERSNRKGKLFRCLKCGRVEDADVNAGFNIAFMQDTGIPRFVKDRDLIKGSTDTPQEALA